MKPILTMSERTPTLRELDRVEDRIRQHRQVEKSAPIILVEGTGDKNVLEPLLPDVQLFSTDGRTNALHAATKLQEWGVRNYVAVVDRDFDGDSEFEALGNIVYPYLGRDLEGMLITLGALHLILRHQSSASKVEAAGGLNKVVTQILDATKPVTALRRASRLNNWGLTFDAVKLHTKVDSSSLEINVHGYCAAVLSQSTTDANLGMLKEAATIDPNGDDDDVASPRGRDALVVAGVALRRLLANLPAAACEEAILTAQLHSSSGLLLSQSDWLGGLRARM
jgi:hypothetical protein